MAWDKHGRWIRYLRISLTDRCNLRCVYCMPEEMVFRPRAELLQDDEILLIVQAATEIGFNKFRLTGGEPTIRHNVVNLVRAIAAIPGVEELTMTTNGVLLRRLAKPLAEAGLQRVNVSLDTLDAGKFQRITRWGRLEDVLDGIKAAEEAGLTPIKLNAVVVRGYNEEDVVEMARLSYEWPWQIRFIEMMPFGDVATFARNAVVTTQEMIARIEAALGPLRPVNGGKLDGEARLYRLEGARGVLGFISTVSQPFCASCSRARLTADGKLRLCLLRDKEVDLLTPIRSGISLEELKALMTAAIWEKPWGHRLDEDVIPVARVMSQIGG
ncbi:MAG: GTP 3',8-cyclase MoaA [Chloroflexi bacterium]|nr:MAG: GTP 3',8-cyclase MoaA [Chloroflexota bacterium]